MLTQNKFFLSIIFILMCVAAIPLPGQPLNTIVLYGILPLVFVLTFIQIKTLKTNTYNNIFICIFLWLIITTIFSTSIEMSLMNVKRTIGSVLVCYIFSAYGKKYRFIPFLYIIFIVLYISSMNYAINNIMAMMTEIGGRERVGDESLNPNTLAYYTFFVTFVIFILGEIVNSNIFKKIFRFVFFLTIPLSFWIAIITASRQVLLLQVPLIFILMYLRYVKYGNAKSRFLIIVLSVIAFMYFANSILEQYEGSFLAERSTISIEDDSRFRLIKESLSMGFNNLFVGVGPGCVQLYTYERAFSHNTFLELFAGTGLLGMILYIMLFVVFFKRQIKRFKETKDRMFAYFLVFGCFFLIEQFLYVFYASLWLMAFFMLVVTHSDTYYFNKYRSKRIKL